MFFYLFIILSVIIFINIDGELSNIPSSITKSTCERISLLISFMFFIFFSPAKFTEVVMKACHS